MAKSKRKSVKIKIECNHCDYDIEGHKDFIEVDFDFKKVDDKWYCGVCLEKFTLHCLSNRLQEHFIEWRQA